MLFSLVVWACVAIFNTGVKGKPPSKIINGREMNIRQAPFVVMLHDSSDLAAFTGLRCGGTIIGKRHILTAAHCLAYFPSDNEMEYDYKWLRVVAGATSYRCGVKTYEILTAFVHPNFDESFDKNLVEQIDIAVLKLKTRIIFGPSQKSIQLARQPPPSKSSGVIYGWGNLLPDEPSLSRKLRKSPQIVYDYETCERLNPDYDFHRDELCVMGDPGTSFCGGDSGGPVIVNGKLVGVISNGLDCGTDMPGAIVNVAHHISWIEDAVRGIAPTRQLPYRVAKSLDYSSEYSDESADSDFTDLSS